MCDEDAGREGRHAEWWPVVMEGGMVARVRREYADYDGGPKFELDIDVRGRTKDHPDFHGIDKVGAGFIAVYAPEIICRAE